MKLKEPMYSPNEMKFWWKIVKSSIMSEKWSIFHKDFPYEIPVEILAYLANDTDWAIRVEVASYPKTPLEILKYFILNDCYGVRASVLQNPNCNDEIRLLYFANRKYGHLTK